MDDAAYDGSPMGEPDATASSGAAPSTAAAHSCTEPPPPQPSAARAADCPPCSTTGRDASRDREPLQIAQFRLGLRAERDKVFDPARRAVRVAERDVRPDTVCSDAAPPLRAKQPHPSGRPATLSRRRRLVATTPTPSWLGSTMTTSRHRTARRSCRPSPWFGLCTSPLMSCVSLRFPHPPSWNQPNRQRWIGMRRRLR